jgi:hypothetical protein
MASNEQEREKLERELELVNKKLESSRIKIELLRRKRNIEERLANFDGKRRSSIGEIPQRLPNDSHFDEVQHNNSMVSLATKSSLHDTTKKSLKHAVSFGNIVKEFQGRKYASIMIPKASRKFSTSGYVCKIPSCTSYNACSQCGLIKGQLSDVSLGIVISMTPFVCQILISSPFQTTSARSQAWSR